MKKLPWQSWTFLAGAAVACVADRGGSGVTDAGADARDAHGGKDAPSSCTAPASNDLSFDLECTGGPCDIKTHLDFLVDMKNPAYPGCGDGQNNLELVDLKTSSPLVGTDKAEIEIDVTSYGGKGGYKLESSMGNSDLLFKLSANPTCEGEAGGPSGLPPLIIQNISLVSEGGFPDAGLSPPSCDVKITTDCTNSDTTHNVTGTLSCSFGDVGAGWSCTVKNGKFRFGHCVP